MRFKKNSSGLERRQKRAEYKRRQERKLFAEPVRSSKHVHSTCAVLYKTVAELRRSVERARTKRVRRTK